MANRNVKFIGYCAEDANVTFNFNGTDVFNGNITAAGSSSSPAELFDFDIDQTVDGSTPATLTVNSGSIVSVSLSVNWETTATDDEHVYNWISNNDKNSKTDIVINDETYDKPDAGLEGAWHVELNEGDVMSCNYTMKASVPVSG